MTRSRSSIAFATDLAHVGEDNCKLAFACESCSPLPVDVQSPLKSFQQWNWSYSGP